MLQISAGLSAPQVYPTVARSLGMGFCTSFSRIGGMIAPFIAQVTRMVLDGAFRCSCPSPSCVLQVLMSRSVVQALCPFALASLLCALGSILLPIETRGRALLVSNLLRLPDLLLHPDLKAFFCFQQNT